MSSCVSRPISENQTVTSVNETTVIPETSRNILQIFSNGKLVSNGVAIGDGSYVITVLDYVNEGYLPNGVLDVETPKGEKFSASIQVLDPRTSATLLKLQDGKIAPVWLINSSEMYEGQQIIFWGWYQPAGELELIKASALARKLGGSPPRFDFTVPQVPQGQIFLLPQALAEKSVVTDAKGNVLGMKGVYFTLYGTQGGFDFPTVLAAENFLNLLSPDIKQQPWINGPVSFYLGNKLSYIEGSGAHADAPPYYSNYASALSQSFTKMGKALTFEEANNIFSQKSNRWALTAVYASRLISGIAMETCLLKPDG